MWARVRSLRCAACADDAGAGAAVQATCLAFSLRLSGFSPRSATHVRCRAQTVAQAAGQLTLRRVLGAGAVASLLMTAAVLGLRSMVLPPEYALQVLLDSSAPLWSRQDLFERVSRSSGASRVDDTVRWCRVLRRVARVL